MKAAIILACLVAACAAEYYSQEKYQKIDVEEIIKNGPQLKAFVVCFTDNATCDDFTGQFKDDFADVVKTACAKCTPLHMHIVNRFLDGAIKTFPTEVGVLAKKVDPDQKLIPALKVAVANA